MAAPAATIGLRQLFVISDSHHGRGKVIFAWNADGNYLCTAGSNGLVHIFDRHGAQVCEVQLEANAPCLALDWDKDGDCVAILQSKVDRVAIWEVAGRRVSYVDTGLKEPTFLKWARAGPQLAIGSARGDLLLFRKDTLKKLTVTGKHSKAITCGDWSRDNRLALGGADSVLTISSADGVVVEQTSLKFPPLGIQFATQKSEARQRLDPAAPPDTTVSINTGGRTVLLYSLAEPEQPVELAFQAKYGRIVSYRWFGDGYMLIGFSEGYVVVLSTHRREITEELFSGRFHKEALADVACSMAAQRAASAGGSTIKLIDMGAWKELKGETASVDAAHGPIESLAWTVDGQIITAGTASGHVYAFLARVPTIADGCGSRIAFLSSLREVSVIDTANETFALSVTVQVEPAFVSLGPGHLAVGMNNRVWFHRLVAGTPPGGRGRGSILGAGALASERDYVATVDEVRLCATHAAVLCQGRIYLHAIEPSIAARQGAPGTIPERDSGAMKVLPEREDAPRATCMAIAGDLLFYGTAGGTVELFSLADWAPLPSCEYRHETSRPIRAVFPNTIGTRVIVLDDTSQGVLYNPVDTRALPISALPEGTNRIVWDREGTAVFVAANAREAATYLYTPVSMTGPSVSQLGALEVQPNGDMVVDPVASPLPNGGTPLALADGVLTCYAQAGGVTSVPLATHDELHRGGRASGERLKAMFAQNVALLRLQAAWEVAFQLDDRSCWLALSGKAMEVLDVEVAQRVYRHLGDAGMVAALESVSRIEDRAGVAGYMALLFGDFPLAQELFLTSPALPTAALDMRRDLLQWDTAQKLAEKLAPEQVPGIALEYGKQLEFRGDHAQALAMYQSAGARLSALVDRRAVAPVAGSEAAVEEERLRRAIHAGVTRMTLRQGDVRRGIAMATEANDKQLCRECAVILESMKQYAEAAALYKRAEQWDKAVGILLLTKNFAAAAPLMELITTPKLHAQYAKAKEAAKEYAEAAQSYERARDMDAVVRLLIDHLNDPERAGAIVRQTRSSEGASAIARYCRGVGDIRGAIEFLLLAKKRDESFALAAEHGEMGLYVQALRIALAATSSGADPSALMAAAAAGGTAATAALAEIPLPSDECARVAGYYEGRGEFASAGRFLSEAGQYHRALKLYLQCGEGELDRAIEVVGRAKNELVTHTLIDYLMGESDGVPKDPHYIFKLYMALGNYPQAAKTALIIARQEQELGNYKVAHAILVETYSDLERHGIRVPLDLLRMLTLLHSYLLVKRHVKAERHDAAAAMMIRVARNVSRFPAHVVPILTSTVIECQRAGLKRSAYEYACVLMRPEHRDGVEEKFRRKIEALVRRPNTEEEAAEAQTPCPFCDVPLPVSDLACGSCKNTIPFCVITGRHMTIADCSMCPACHFPALHSELQTYLSAGETTCPLCSQAITLSAVSLLRDPASFLRKAAGAVGEDDGGGGETARGGGGGNAPTGDAASLAAAAGKER